MNMEAVVAWRKSGERGDNFEVGLAETDGDFFADDFTDH
jgi:hypothetical protein